MARQFAINDTAPGGTRFADAFVIFSVTVLSLAFGAWFLLQLGVALWAGTVAALAIYTALLSFHLLVRRSVLYEEAPVREPWVKNAFARAEAAPSEFAPEDDVPTIGRTLTSAEAEARRWAEAAAANGQAPRDELPVPRGPDLFHFRPSREPTLAVGAPGAIPPPVPGAAQLPDEPEVSVEVIHDLIKKLADELNNVAPSERYADTDAGPEGFGAREPALGRSAMPGVRRPRAMPPIQPAADADPAGPPLRVPSWPRVEPPQAQPGARPPEAPPALNPQLARIAEAVAAERMEVLLEPIHALAEGRPRHFEVSVRLLTADGGALDQREFSRMTRGTGLMSRIDAARMVRAARVARRLGERGRKGSVLAQVDGDSLTDESFLVAAAAEPGNHGMGLVLSFAQSEVRAFTPGHARAIETLAGAGFRFALEEVTDLDMDFAALQAMGFEFVKLDAQVFLDGLPAAGGRIPASDICRYLADFGLALVVGRIEDDWLLARILGFGVLFGKGALFGEPRLVKDDVVAEPAA